MNNQEFTALAKAGYNRIPVVRQVLADLETPLGIYLKLAHGKYSYFLESMQGGEKWGRYSFVGVDPQPLKEVDHSAGRTGGLESLRAIYADVRVAPVPAHGARVPGMSWMIASARGIPSARRPII